VPPGVRSRLNASLPFWPGRVAFAFSAGSDNGVVAATEMVASIASVRVRPRWSTTRVNLGHRDRDRDPTRVVCPGADPLEPMLPPRTKLDVRRSSFAGQRSFGI